MSKEKKTTLIVEDNLISNFVMKEALIDEFQVFCAMNGDEMKSYFEEHKVDCILMDINLGETEKSGIDLMKEIKKNSDVKIIAVTAYPPDEENGYLKMGFDGYLSKPLHFSSVKDYIENLLEQTSIDK